MLENKSNPEQISRRLKRDQKISISYETIYQYIWKDKKNGGNLYLHLRRFGKKYNKRSSSSAGRGCIPDRVNISERSKVVEKKKQIGHIEGDTIIGKNHTGAILTLVERVSKILIMKKMNNVLKPLKKAPRTMTLDNGKEFSKHRQVSKSLGIKVYFARPYHSWEK